MKWIAALLVTSVASLAMGGCDAQSSLQADAGKETAATQSKDQEMPALKPPSADSVLYFIYQRDGDGAVTYQVDGGATVSYWYGHAFDFKGKHYFTGFASKTEGDEGPDGDAGMMEPGHVAISQATFVRVDEDGKQAWSQPDTDGYVGEFGRNGRAEELDTSRQVQSHPTEDGRLLIAIPTRDFMNGTDVRMFALFLFDPDSVDSLGFRQWGYLGSIAAGDDNSAACDEGHVMPCVASTGVLSFGPETDAGLPRLNVALSGQTIAGPNQVRPLGKGDAVTYAFNVDTGSYEP